MKPANHSFPFIKKRSMRDMIWLTATDTCFYQLVVNSFTEDSNSVHQAPGLSMSAAAKTLSQVMSRWACIAVTTKASNWLIQNNRNRPLESMHPMLHIDILHFCCWTNHRGCDWSYTWAHLVTLDLGRNDHAPCSGKHLSQEISCSRHRCIPKCANKSTHLRIWELSPHDRLAIRQIYAQPSAGAISSFEWCWKAMTAPQNCKMKWQKSDCWYCLASNHLCRM